MVKWMDVKGRKEGRKSSRKAHNRDKPVLTVIQIVFHISPNPVGLSLKTADCFVSLYCETSREKFCEHFIVYIGRVSEQRGGRGRGKEWETVKSIAISIASQNLIGMNC